jgi:hydrogen peroxide-dependent heme synthase
MSALPPATLEGWYSLHQAFEIDFRSLGSLPRDEREELAQGAHRLFAGLAVPNGSEGWTGAYRLAGGGADVMLVHFRPTLDELSDVAITVKQSSLGPYLKLVYDYLAVTEVGLYHATAEAAREHEPGSEEYKQAIAEQAAAEAASQHVKTRLYPSPPEEMRYLSFYPMTKRRNATENWYALDVAERSRLMREHGMTGRRYAGRVFQVITGSVGLDDWEWGVTLFARDPLEFKRIVTEMRYDEASARYSDFGRFFTGSRMMPDGWLSLLGGG